MKAAERAADIIHRLVQWADSQPLVRAMVLTSSRANDRAPIDLLSDYDVILVITDSASGCQPGPEKRLDYASVSEHSCSFDHKL